jgi:hypothetical protein
MPVSQWGNQQTDLTMPFTNASLGVPASPWDSLTPLTMTLNFNYPVGAIDNDAWGYALGYGSSLDYAKSQNVSNNNTAITFQVDVQ